MPTMSSIEAASLWSGLLILVLVCLSAHVVLGRQKHRVLVGDGGVDAMTFRTRAFGNAAEYIPAGIGALILLALMHIPAIWIHGIGATFLLGRVLHPFGMKAAKGPPAARALGMVLTWLPLLFAASILIYHPLAG